MIRRLLSVGLLLLTAACSVSELIENDTLTPLQVQQSAAVKRHLAGETAMALGNLASESYRLSFHQKLPDSARFVRENPSEKAAELSREMLWRCAEVCNVQFSGDPESFIRNMRATELHCRAAILIAEKQYLDLTVWKNRDQQRRSRELDSESSQLFGDVPYAELANIPLPTADEMRRFSADAAVPVSEDPAEALQIAGVFCLLPAEIQRQQFADPAFRCGGILLEVLFTAADYALSIDLQQLQAAEKAYEQNPSAETLFIWRKWYFRAQTDKARRPVARGSSKDRQFLNSMLLLQESF